MYYAVSRHTAMWQSSDTHSENLLSNFNIFHVFAIVIYFGQMTY